MMHNFVNSALDNYQLWKSAHIVLVLSESTTVLIPFESDWMFR